MEAVQMRLVVLAVLTCVLAACGQSSTPSVLSSVPGLPGQPTSTTAPAGPSGPLLAYRSATQIGLVDGTEAVASAKGTFAPSSDPLLTEDGKYVFALGTDGLAVLDVATRKSRVVAVPRGSAVGTAGGSIVVWWEQPDRLMQLDLSDPAGKPAVRQNVTLPPAPGTASLLVARAGTAILVQQPQTPGGPDTLYAVRGSGAPTSLGTSDANTPIATATLSPDGSSLAYALYRQTSDVCGTAAIVVSDAAGAQQSYDVTSPEAGASSRVLRMWWQDGQPMSLSLATWQCAPMSAYSPLIWQLGGAGLTAADPKTVALQDAEVAPGQRALIIPKGGAAPETSGTLIVEDSGRRIPVESAVDAIDVVPAP
jgi:hypothetical protein